MQECSPEIKRLLAPTGRLRTGLYPGSPNSFIAATQVSDSCGVGFELGRMLALTLGITFEPVLFKSNAEVLAAGRRGEIDFLLANATPARAEYLTFTRPVLVIEQGYLVAADSCIQNIESIDQAHIKIGVSAGSTSESVLPTLLNHAKVYAVDNLKDVETKIRTGELDAFATNKAILFSLSDHLDGAQVLTGAWGVENISIGIPLIRHSILPYIQSFANEMHASGFITQAAQRAGLRGLSAKHIS